MGENVELDDLQMEAEKETFQDNQEVIEQDVVVESSLDAQILREIKEEVERRFQSAKDKRWAQLEKQYGSLSDLQKKPKSEDQALPVVVNPEKLLSNVQSWVKNLGLEEDQAVIDMLKEEGAGIDLESYLDLINKLTLRVLEKSNASPISAGSVIQPGGGNAPMEDLQQVYERARNKIRPGDVNALMSLKRKFRGKGLDVF